jgi:predicted small secreted protein
MKKIIISTLLASAFTLTGCATSHPVGALYTDINVPVTATSNADASKTGTATCKSYLAMIAMGDCSIDAAKRNGNISRVSHVDQKANNILGLIGTYTVTVKGE